VTDSPAPRQTTRVVASNSFWYGVDSALGIAMVFAVSIPMARIIGPERLGYFNYVMWLTGISGLVGSLGVPGTTGKFMAEYLGKGEPGTARAIFRHSLRIQIASATLITTAALVVLVAFGDPAHRFVSTIQILSVLPMMVTQIPTNANLANERMRTNVPSSVVSNLVFVTATLASLWFRWDLVGIASGMLLARVTELTIRYTMTQRWISELPMAQLSDELRVRMRRFAMQQVYVLLLSIVVFDKSDVVLLKLLSPDIRQITFFTVAFNLVERITLLPQVFASALSTSLLAQQGRDSAHVPRMAADAARYMFLVAMPLLFGMALVSDSIVRLLYGQRYLEVIPVLTVAATFGIVKPLIQPIEAVFFARSRQVRMLIWATTAGLINLGADWLLIPWFGATGAALANGGAQMLLVFGYWLIGIVWFEIKLDWRGFGRITVSALSMAPAVLLTRRLAPALALPAGALCGAAVFALMLKVTSALNDNDAARLRRLSTMVPKPLERHVNSLVSFLVPA
jgi:O-antigen/teichoic acid export membrane protein